MKGPYELVISCEYSSYSLTGSFFLRVLSSYAVESCPVPLRSKHLKDSIFCG